MGPTDHALNRWAAKAKPNEVFVYHDEGEGWPRSARAFNAAMALSDAKLVFLTQRKVVRCLNEPPFEDCTQTVWQHVAIRCRPQDRTILDKVSRRTRVKPSAAYLQQAA